MMLTPKNIGVKYTRSVPTLGNSGPSEYLVSARAQETNTIRNAKQNVLKMLDRIEIFILIPSYQPETALNLLAHRCSRALYVLW
jgi:hypothetical protein